MQWPVRYEFRRAESELAITCAAFLVVTLALLPASANARRDENGQVRSAELMALRAAVDDLSATFGAEYAGGPEFRRRLDGLWGRFGRAEPDEVDRIEAEFAELRQDALLAHPLLRRHSILFVVRPQYKPDHHNTATMFQTGEINTGSFQGGGAIKALDLAAGGRVTTLIETAEGMVRDPEVHFDGERIVFAMRRNIDDDYHIYEMRADGTRLRQLTFAASVADIDPLYLPDDRIAFGSTREPKYCMCNRHIMCNLFCMDGDGANIHQIGKNTLHEGHPVLMPDGRVLYDRWEYVDRNFGDAQGLWTVNPDGTNHAVFYGNNTWSPGGAIDARAVPGTHGVLCVFGSCHDRPWGALALLDPQLGVDGRSPVVRTWPADAIDLVQEAGPRPDVYGFDDFKRVQPKYEDPYPLSDKYFLCSRLTGRGEQMGLYLIDVFGNEVLVHAEGPGCFDPMPLGPRLRPPVVPSRRHFEPKAGTFYVLDVYEGTHMAGVERGAVKYLRVVESPEKRFWTRTEWGGQGVHCPAVNWHGFENKRILGTVPVEADGSAYFEVPAGKFVYFQLLDANKMMVQSMRSGATIQPGELMGCVGCHESRQTSVPEQQGAMPLAMKRPPSRLDGWNGPPRLFSYIEEVQPVFDRHCVRCHDYGQEAGGKLNLAADRTNTFNTSYNELWRKKAIAAIGAGPADIQRAYSWGAHASRLVKVLRDGHEDLDIPVEDFERIVTWIDINGPYYPRYDTAYPDHLAGRSPLDNTQIHRLAELTRVPLHKLARHNSNQGPQVSFDRPELSPCLAKVSDANGPEYAEALAIIRAGQEQLRQRPRADMPGFQACVIDRQRQARYIAREDVEERNRAAIRNERKRYDARP
jgi:hypothetical protein